MITAVSIASFILVAFGMFAPTDMMVSVPGIDWASLNMIWVEVPSGYLLILIGRTLHISNVGWYL